MIGTYFVWEPAAGQTREDAEEIRAVCASAAAERWAERRTHLCAEFVDEAEVMVQLDGFDAPQAFHVEGEMVPSWSAREVSP